ncbi:MAG: SDR family oxidoreductase [Ahrensia sp.]|nr:SDR family oxidoreductase [Ahrensia sp.]
MCLVTGASTGIGGHLSRLLLSRGAVVVGIGLSEIDWDCSHTQDRFGYISGDLRDDMMVDKIFEHFREKFGRIDLIVNNAGISQIERASDFTSDTLKDIFAVNVISVGMVASKGAKLMRDTGTGGSIINVTSVMADSAMMGLSAYSSSKAALDQMTRASGQRVGAF